MVFALIAPCFMHLHLSGESDRPVPRPIIHPPDDWMTERGTRRSWLAREVGSRGTHNSCVASYRIQHRTSGCQLQKLGGREGCCLAGCMCVGGCTAVSWVRWMVRLRGMVGVVRSERRGRGETVRMCSWLRLCAVDSVGQGVVCVGWDGLWVHCPRGARCVSQDTLPRCLSGMRPFLYITAIHVFLRHVCTSLPAYPLAACPSLLPSMVMCVRGLMGREPPVCHFLADSPPTSQICLSVCLSLCLSVCLSVCEGGVVARSSCHPPCRSNESQICSLRSMSMCVERKKERKKGRLTD